MKLSTCLNQFFVQYLPRIKGSSEKTIHAYRDTCSLLLPFAAEYHQIAHVCHHRQRRRAQAHAFEKFLTGTSGRAHVAPSFFRTRARHRTRNRKFPRGQSRLSVRIYSPLKGGVRD